MHPVLITVSEISRQRIQKLFPKFPEDRMAIIPNSWSVRSSRDIAVGESSRLRRLLKCAPPELLLYSGGWGGVKNNCRLLEAFAAAFGTDSGVGLVVTGNARNTSAIWELIEKLEVEDRVIVTGVLSNHDLEWLYSVRCAGVVSISEYEGFGRPCVEAMIYGVPLVCSDIPTNREVAGEYAIYCDPTDISSITAAFHRLRTATRVQGQLDPRFDLGTNSRRYVEMIRRLLPAR